MWDLIWEVLHMGVLILIASYFLHYYAFKDGIEDEKNEVTHSYESDDGTSDKYGTSNPILIKWLHFGGGYYGVVAFVKLLFIEFAQLKGFVSDWQGLDQFIAALGLQTIINFFVEQMKAFVQAIIWPTHYLSTFSILHCAIFVISTYALYLLSKHWARKKIPIKQG